jgi:hypothetical protein
MRFKVFFLFFFFLSLRFAATAQTINAASCNQSDVQKAFSSVTASTTTVNIPAGSCTWSSTVTLTVPSGSTALTVQGQTTCTGAGRGGTLSCTDNTKIGDNLASVSSGDSPLLSITTQSGAPFTLKGLSITGTGSSPVQTYQGHILIYGGSESVRLTQNHFMNISAVMMGLGNGTAGVADHNIFSQGSASIIFRTQAATGSDWAGQIPWSQPTNLGTSNQWYFEDNQLTGGGTDCDRGGRFVVRFNTFTAENGQGEFLLTHPTGEPGGAIRGCRAWEAYGNTFSIPTGQYTFSLWFLSSGTGVTWGNTIAPASGAGLDNFFTFISERSNNTTYSQTAAPNGWGYCGTYFNGTGSPWDQNSNTTNGYRCLDNPGTGQADALSVGNSFPNLVDTVTKSASWPHQASEPIYEWMDTYTPGNWINANQYSSISPLPIQQNADFYLWCNASSTTGCTTFDGTQGVGSGTLASRPSSCTAGVAYWASDQGTWNSSGSGGQGQLYKCTSTNTWTLFYTPYTYPHPLVSGTTSSASGPAPPTGLTGTVVQ